MHQDEPRSVQYSTAYKRPSTNPPVFGLPHHMHAWVEFRSAETRTHSVRREVHESIVCICIQLNGLVSPRSPVLRDRSGRAPRLLPPERAPAALGTVSPPTLREVMGATTRRSPTPGTQDPQPLRSAQLSQVYTSLDPDEGPQAQTAIASSTLAGHRHLLDADGKLSHPQVLLDSKLRHGAPPKLVRNRVSKLVRPCAACQIRSRDRCLDPCFLLCPQTTHQHPDEALVVLRPRRRYRFPVRRKNALPKGIVGAFVRR